MLTKRIIPCLDVKDGQVVKGVKFKNHKIVGSILDLAKKYSDEGADELVFYDISASTNNTMVSKKWIEEIAKNINIPFCVAGGINSIESARLILNSGADKISVNTPAIENPILIKELAKAFGSQCVTVGIDSMQERGQYIVYSKTGNVKTSFNTKILTKDWIIKVQELGAGEIVLNCMNQDGVKRGFDIKQLNYISDVINVPLIASGGAGKEIDFFNVLNNPKISGALAASVFHNSEIQIEDLKNFLKQNNIHIR
ncbi:imidazole glycerol phosphate synthase subunit HisF [Gammaproteobacteria bacterium]|nr:imidazole glycerol phosphate synthase subunit HisF [Gammaproteobacteria bacterium]MDA9041408.1 imidazole glycerol phosphate synthase subunit HisF [Gammaproteobacteria bacterium]